MAKFQNKMWGQGRNMPYFFTVVSIENLIILVRVYIYGRKKFQGDMSINYKQFHEVQSHLPTWLFLTLKTMWANR